jgi:UDPglucose 6-dehydrogenase
MNISVIGTGYVGLVSGAGLADLGHNVVCIDMDAEKIAALQGGRIPIFEPGLEELVQRNMKAGRLRFSNELAEAVAQSLVVFLAVGTHAKADGTPDLSQVWAAVDAVAGAVEGWKAIVIKSTVPVGTAAQLRRRISSSASKTCELSVVSNPEFLREGAAVEDFFHPNRIVIGADSDHAIAVLTEVYRPLYLIRTPFIITTSENAELIKYAANSFLAMKVSFVNELANLCDAVGREADIHIVAHALGLDPRIGGKFLHPSPGYGGYCFPKDTRALSHTARQFGMKFRTVDATIEVNEEQYLRIIAKVEKALHSVQDKTLAVLGLAFKPNTDDVRESRAIKICEHLLNSGAHLRVFDPAAMEQAQRVLNSGQIVFCGSSLEAAQGADGLIIATEWNEFRNLDLAQLKAAMRGDAIIDARNVIEGSQAREFGLRYWGIGRC